MLFKLIWNELRKEFFTTWSYKWQWVGEFISLLLFFMFLKTLSQNPYASVEYCIWFFSVLIIGDISGKISTEMRSGTLEQMYLSCVSVSTLFMCKAITSLIRALAVMTGLFLILLGIGAAEFTGIRLEALEVLLIITPGLFGISLFVGGVTVYFKEMGWILNVVNNTILFLSGVFVPLESFPDYLRRFSLLIPTTQAIKILHLNDFSTKKLFLCLVFNFCYFCLGLFFFWFFEKKAKMMGVLGHH